MDGIEKVARWIIADSVERNARVSARRIQNKSKNKSYLIEIDPCDYDFILTGTDEKYTLVITNKVSGAEYSRLTYTSDNWEEVYTSVSECIPL